MNEPLAMHRTFVFSATRKGRKVVSTIDAAPLAPTQVPNLTRWLALVLHVDELVASGQIADYAEVARRYGISRARVSQLMNLSLLATDIQEQILQWPRQERARDRIPLQQVQSIALESDWAKQRKAWRALLERCQPVVISQDKSSRN